LLVCKAFDFSFTSEWKSCWVEISWLYVLPVYHFKYIVLFPFWFVEFLLRNQLMILWEFPCYFSFPLVAFNILSLSLIFFSVWFLCVSGRSCSVSCRWLLLSPGSWCMQDFVCVLQEWSLFPPGLWKSYNQILLACKVRFLGDT